MSETAELYCPECGYDLRGASGDSIRCPECGSVHQRDGLSVSRIPWIHRHEIGRVRAWWRTCWMALFGPSDVAASLTAPLLYTDARRFWLICVLAVAPAFVFPVFLLYDTPRVDPTPFTSTSALWDNLATPWLLGVEHIALPSVYMLVALLLASGSVSYLFQLVPLEHRRQDRAAALGLYAAGALVAGFLPGAPLALLFILPISYAYGPVELGNLLPLGWVLLLLATSICWSVAAVMTYQRVCHAGIGRTLFAATAIGLIGVGATIISFALLPFLVGMVRIFIAFFD